MPYNAIFIIIFLPVILFIGFITSYEDFSISKIRNKWILIGLLYPLIIYSFSWILYGVAVNKIVSPFIGRISSYLIWNFDKWCINLTISIAVAYLLWHFKMWGAGDAKLFICYAALIPMGQYSKVYFNYYFASFSLLLAIFIPATAFLFLKSWVYFIKRLKFKEGMPKLFKEKFNNFNKVEAGKVFIGFFVFFLFFKILRKEVYNLVSRILPNQSILILITLLIFKPLSKIFKKKIKFTLAAFVILIVYFGFMVSFSWQEFLVSISNIFSRTVVFMVLFGVFKKIVELYTEKTLQKFTPFALWMFLGAFITWFL
jgi:Flp pilus assembly protein protease CpaA